MVPISYQHVFVNHNIPYQATRMVQINTTCFRLKGGPIHTVACSKNVVKMGQNEIFILTHFEQNLPSAFESEPSTSYSILWFHYII